MSSQKRVHEAEGETPMATRGKSKASGYLDKYRFRMESEKGAGSENSENHHSWNNIQLGNREPVPINIGLLVERLERLFLGSHRVYYHDVAICANSQLSEELARQISVRNSEDGLETSCSSASMMKMSTSSTHVPTPTDRAGATTYGMGSRFSLRGG
ncbi:unnamed protein product [Orchesella dallaii]|uniref:Uncharacterized protein n=1 Tax=Orchesella dallaii TaxID=48710 RepID=A0ABP1RR04_9HEXA